MSSQVLKFLDSNYFLEEHRYSIDHIKELYNKRLYYELSEFIIQFFTNFEKDDCDLFDFFDIVIMDISKRINPITFARIVITVAVKLKKFDIDRAIAFVTKNLELPNIRDDKTAFRICKIYLAKLNLYKGLLVTAHDILFQFRIEIESANNVSILHLFFYDAILYYHYLKKDHFAYHHDVLKYYGAYSKIKIFIDDDGVSKPLFCAISTIVSPHITNMGEVICNQLIFPEIVASSQSWMADLLNILFHGDIKGFDEIAHKIESHDVLGQLMMVIREKVALMNILNLALDCIIHRRSMTFKLISESAKISIDSVERFLIRAFTLDMVRGSIDQINQVVELTWVKPKFITPPYVAILKEQLIGWNKQICQLHDSLVSSYTSG